MKIQFYDIILYDKLARMAQEYIIANRDSQGFWWRRDKQIKSFETVAAMWEELDNEVNRVYPEFINKSKTFELSETKNYPLSIMKVSRK